MCEGGIGEEVSLESRLLLLRATLAEGSYDIVNLFDYLCSQLIVPSQWYEIGLFILPGCSIVLRSRGQPNRW